MKNFNCECGEKLKENFYPNRKNICKNCLKSKTKNRYQSMTEEEKTLYKEKQKKTKQMNALTKDKQISTVGNSVRKVSYEEKKYALSTQESVDLFLDAISIFKKGIAKRTTKILRIITLMEGLTWFNEVSEKNLEEINGIIASAMDIVNSLRKQAEHFKVTEGDTFAVEERTEFINAIDDLEETCKDLEDIFFVLPHNAKFQETNKALSSL